MSYPHPPGASAQQIGATPTHPPAPSEPSPSPELAPTSEPPPSPPMLFPDGPPQESAPETHRHRSKRPRMMKLPFTLFRITETLPL